MTEIRVERDQSNLNSEQWKCPKWSRGFLWVRNASSLTPSATLTELAEPLPGVPPSELNNLIPNATLISHMHLLQIITPINVDLFQTLLSSHPNQPLINSICHGLCEGFWPFAKFGDSTPDTWDNSACQLEGPNLVFTLKQ